MNYDRPASKPAIERINALIVLFSIHSYDMVYTMRWLTRVNNELRGRRRAVIY